VTADADLVTGGSAFEVVAEAVTEVVAADVDRRGMELRGLEPLTYALPARRSSS
jgi:hypothetical protein